MLRVALFAALAIVAFGDHRSQHVATTETPPSEWWLDHAIAIYNYTTSSKDYTGASRMCETETSFIVQFHGGPWVGEKVYRAPVTGMVGATKEQCLAAQVARSTPGYCTPSGSEASDGIWCPEDGQGLDLGWGGQIDNSTRPPGCFYSSAKKKMYFNVANSTGAQCNCLSCLQPGGTDYCSMLCVPGPAFPSTEPTAVPNSQGSTNSQGTCAETKAAYKSSSCCNQAETTFANYSQCVDYKATYQSSNCCRRRRTVAT